jgi:TPR repeat protein
MVGRPLLSCLGTDSSGSESNAVRLERRRRAAAAPPAAAAARLRRGCGAIRNWPQKWRQKCAHASRTSSRVPRCPPVVIFAMSLPASVLTLCAACGASSPLVCASCLKTRFCSPACAAAAWAGHRAACAEFSVLAELPDEALAPVPPAAPLASMEPAGGAGVGVFEHPGTGFDCAVCGKADAAVCARCRLVGYCGAEHQRKDWPTHKAVCRKGEFGVVPVLSWEQRMLAEAHAAAPASLAATAALPPIPGWNIDRDGAPPSKIMRAWRKAADGGHARAQFRLGVCFSFGKGVEKDAVAAAEWYAKAAAQGLAAAQFNLGFLNANGSGVAQDLKAAAAWYAKAAAQGDADAQRNLGVLYQKGTGVAQDVKAAAAWFAKAAAQGDADAQFNLGILYKKGTGVAQDLKTAAAWYAKAAAQGNADAQFNLGACYWKGEGVAQDFKAAAAWYAKAAAQGHADAHNNLGLLYCNGTGVAQDFKAAAAWYAKAAAQGQADAQFNLGICYWKGEGVSQDFKAAAAWYAKAAAQGHAVAQYNLGVTFEHGTGVVQDFKAAAAWFAKAAASGDFEAPARRDACLARVAAAAVAASRP